jgi:tetratricopeptide (TPR) repeat protein
MMRVFFLITAALASAACAEVNLHLKDGRILPAKQLRRDRDSIIATLEIPSKQPGGPSTTGDFGFALKDVFKLDFPKPAVLDSASDLIAEGKAVEALAQLDPVLKYYAGFRDAPGSWWMELVPVQVEALLALRQDKEATDVAEQFNRLSEDPEVKKFSKAFTAVARTRNGKHEAALPLYDEMEKETERTDLLGLVAVNKGESLVAIADALVKQGEAEKAAVRYEEALLSFLRIPALYPMQRMYLPQALYGAARTYLAMQDFDRARRALKELTVQFPATPEAKAAPELSARIEKLAALRGTPEPARE